MFQRLGAAPTQVAAADIYPSLERGTLDAVEFVGPHDDEKLGFVRVAKYYYAPGFWEPGARLHLLVNKAAYEALPDQYKAAIETACNEQDSEMMARYDDLNPKALRRLIAAGAQLRFWPRDVMQAAWNASNEVYAETSSRNPRFKKIHDAYMPYRNEQYQWFRVAGEFLRQLRLPRGGGPLTPRGIGRWGGAFTGPALAVCMAAALRLPGLGHWSLWVDEIATAGFATLPWPVLTGPLARLETTPPTYYLLIKAWTLLMGDGDAALRLPSALAGIASVAVLWLLCRDAFGRRAAFWAAMILAVAGWHLFHSREARVYAILTLVFLLALLAGRAFAARAVLPGAGWFAPAAALAVLAGLLPWLHFSGVVAAATAFLHTAALMLARGTLGRRALARLSVAGLGCAVLALPVLGLAWSIAARGGQAGIGWMQPLGLGFAGLSMLRVLLLSPWTVDPWIVLGPACAGLAALVVMPLVWRALRPAPLGAERIAFVATLVAGVTLFAAAQMVEPVVLPRTLLVLVPLVAGLMGAGLARLRPRSLRAGAYAVFLASQAPSLHDAFGAPPDGSDWRALTARLAGDPAGRPAVLVLDAFDALALERYRVPGGSVADLVLLPPDAPGLQRFAATSLTTARPVAPAGLLPALCGSPAAGAGLVVVERRSPVLDDRQGLIDTALRPAGARPGAAQGERSLRLRPWTPPACPPPLPARP